MQPHLRHLLFLSLLSLVVAGQPLHAQYITVTAADVQAQLAPGNTLSTHNDSLTTRVNIGRKGASSWDFSALRTDALQVYTSVPVATTPYVAGFPGATHALQATLTYMGITGTGYQYLILGTHLLNPGLKAGSGSLTLTTTNTPLDTTYFLPSTYGSTWRSTFTATTVGVAPPFGEFLRQVKSYAYVYTADAYGPVTIPDGTTHQSLRIRKTNTLTGGVGYIFLARDGATVQLNAASSAEPDSGLINVGLGSIAWTPVSLYVPVAGMELTPLSLNTGSSAASFYVRVRNTGTGPLNWTASANDAWLAAAARGVDSIAVTCEANPLTSPRTGTVTVTSNAINSPQTITVTQAGVAVQPVLAVTPDTARVSWQAGSTEFTVQNTGNGTMTWNASSNQPWATISSGSSGSNDGKITISLDSNSSTLSRSASITVTAPGAMGSPRTVVVTQAGVPIQTVLAVSPDTAHVPWQAGVAECTVRNIGNGTMSWSAVSGQAWATITEGATGSDSGKIRVSVSANPSVLQRMAAITVTAPGAAGSPKQVMILQDSCEAPGVPLLAAPRDSLILIADSVRLAWHPAAVTTSAYWLELGVEPQASALISDSTITDTTYMVRGLVQGSTYGWHVRAKNPTGWGPFSVLWHFIRVVPPPVAVLLRSPANGAVVGKDSVRLTWLAQQPPGSVYRLEVASDSAFAVRVIDSTLVDSAFVVRKLTAVTTYWWRVTARNASGQWGPVIPAWEFSIGLTSAPFARLEIPGAFQLYQNYPNPFNPSTTIRYGVPRRSRVNLTVFNTLGQRVAGLVDASVEPGLYEVRFDASTLPAGVYFYRMTAGGYVRTLRFLLIR